MDGTDVVTINLSSIPQPAVFYFYGYWQAILCLFSTFALLSIWWHIGRKEKDYGLLWLSVAVFWWSLSGLVELFYANQLTEIIQSHRGNLIQMGADLIPLQTKVESGRSILSLFNSAFILLALPCFKHIPKRIAPIIQAPTWTFIVVLPLVISLSVNIGILFGVFTPSQIPFINTLDFVYAIVITLPFLGWILWDSFAKRKLNILAWLALICIGLTLIAQISKLNENYLFKVIASSIFKPMLIMLFFALALSWVKELAEHVLPAPHQMGLSFFTKKVESGRMDHFITLTVPSIAYHESIKLTKSRHQLLFKFAQALKSNDPWLEIKPKNDPRQNRAYDINDHNEIKRLIDNLLDEIHGKSNWEPSVERPFLKDALFEFSPDERRKVKLRIAEKRINLVIKKGVT